MTSCGYQIVGPPELVLDRKLHVALFESSLPTSPALDLHAALVRELGSFGLVLVSDPKEADLVLQGRIETAATAPVALRSISTGVPAYRMQFQISARISDRARKTVWEGRAEASEHYLAASFDRTDWLLESEANRRRALMLAAEHAAVGLVAKLMSER